jgi:rhamnose utilization protein RhaD (predicted bifunctional aldolase and dehydrogenase)/NAD(P)-dependent dehydrogenase (short-subunit alcohol dehydrogenase family)
MLSDKDKKSIRELVNISQYYGKNKEFAIAGGGNTSYKNQTTLWVKASGVSLGDIDENGFVALTRKDLNVLNNSELSEDTVSRERQVKNALLKSRLFPDLNQRPSVEASLHDLINYSFVVHMHPTYVNGLLCSQDAEKISQEIFGQNALYVKYTDPGYILYKKVKEKIEKYRQSHSSDPKIILLQNHGIFVAADGVDEVKSIYEDILGKIKSKLHHEISIKEREKSGKINEIMPAVRMLLSGNTLKIVKFRNNSLIEHFCRDKSGFERINKPFTPDIIVYCKSDYIYIDETGSAESIITAFEKELSVFRKRHSFDPKVILIKNIGLFGVDESASGASTVLDVFEDLMKISYLTQNFGGPHFMDKEQIDFIESWEVENYRRKILQSKSADANISNKIIIVTGGAQGFGAGIAENFYNKGANVVIADINAEQGHAFIEKTVKTGQKNHMIFVKTDVSQPDSVENLINLTVREFGGLDVFVSNAGVLRAGGLYEMDPDTFDFMTRVNYKGYFLCAKFASRILKLQADYKKGYFTDIIQINSKSGLKGSNKNFAYAGGKFGSIGLTQSFAMELMPWSIKVNSICPGNFFDGPLWSDPENGLFVQYLRAGKVPGAKTIEDVKKHYENQVPARRGCHVEDVMKAIIYIINQQYETGQALPVTGGQIMLH